MKIESMTMLLNGAGGLGKRFDSRGEESLYCGELKAICSQLSRIERRFPIQVRILSGVVITIYAN